MIPRRSLLELALALVLVLVLVLAQVLLLLTALIAKRVPLCMLVGSQATRSGMHTRQGSVTFRTD